MAVGDRQPKIHAYKLSMYLHITLKENSSTRRHRDRELSRTRKPYFTRIGREREGWERERQTDRDTDTERDRERQGHIGERDRETERDRQRDSIEFKK